MHKPLSPCHYNCSNSEFSRPLYIARRSIQMERIQKSQIAKILLLVFFIALLFLTPFISSSMRSSYLYFLLNLLIIVLGVEAGFLSAISKPRDERKLASVVVTPMITGGQQDVTITTTGASAASTDIMRPAEAKPTMIMERPITAARVGVSAAAEKVKSTLKRCKSRPSLFFIGSLEPDCGEEEKNEEEVIVVKIAEEETGELSKQELFMKAEMFIGNFYKQLKMQRDNSWQKLQGLYH